MKRTKTQTYVRIYRRVYQISSTSKLGQFTKIYVDGVKLFKEQYPFLSVSNG